MRRLRLKIKHNLEICVSNTIGGLQREDCDVCSAGWNTGFGFGRVLSAPYGTLALADLGADVVKVEHPDYGDDTRCFGPLFVDDISSYFYRSTVEKDRLLLT